MLAAAAVADDASSASDRNWWEGKLRGHFKKEVG